MPKVTPEHLNARRNQILEAARACFNRRGFHQATIQDICQECGLSPGAIYRYFRGKDDIVWAISGLQREQVLADIEELKGRHTAMEILDFMGERFFGFLEQPEARESVRGSLEFWAESVRDERMRELARRDVQEYRDAFADIVRRGIEEGHFSPELNPEACASVMIALFEGLQLQVARNPELVDVHEYYRTVRALLFGDAWRGTGKGKQGRKVAGKRER